MSLRKITAAKVFFITISVYRHIDFFTRREYSEFLLEWIRLYQSEYGLVVYDWVIMPNHLHLIVSSKETDIHSLITDFKSSSELQFLEMIEKGKDDYRRSWFLELFRTAHKQKIFWRGNFHCQGIYVMSYYLNQQQKIYRDPVRQWIVFQEKDYVLSSCYYKGKAGTMGQLPIEEVSSDLFQEERVEING